MYIHGTIIFANLQIKMNPIPVTHKVGEENEQQHIQNTRNYIWQFNFVANVIVKPPEVVSGTPAVSGTQFNATALDHLLQ
jgi:hypothetical protein